MTAWKASPAILQNMRIRFCTNIDGYKGMRRWVFFGLAARNQIRSRSSNRVLDNICEEDGQGQADEKSKDRNMSSVEPRSCEYCPSDYYNERNAASIYEHPQARDPFDKSMWI